MKATLTIKICDDTSEEALNQSGLYRHDLAAMYQRAFAQLVQLAAAPGCDVTIDCVVTDNTKEGDG